MELNLVPVYLQDVTFKNEKVRDKNVKVCVATLFVQPLTYELAGRIGIQGELYEGRDKPHTIIRKAEYELNEGKRTHKIELHTTVDGSTDPMFLTDDAFVGRSIKVRKDKEAPIFAATFEINFTYPIPQQLVSLANGINEQFWLVIAPTNPGLFEEADREAARDEKKRRAKKEPEQQEQPAPESVGAQA